MKLELISAGTFLISFGLSHATNLVTGITVAVGIGLTAIGVDLE